VNRELTPVPVRSAVPNPRSNLQSIIFEISAILLRATALLDDLTTAKVNDSFGVEVGLMLKNPARILTRCLYLRDMKTRDI